MDDMNKYLCTIEENLHKMRLLEIFDWIIKTFPTLEYKTLWNQPMFLEHGTFIIGFSASKKHFSVSAESKGIQQFTDEIRKAGYSQSKNLFRIGWSDGVDYTLLERIIQYNRIDKLDCTTFWRK